MNMQVSEHAITEQGTISKPGLMMSTGMNSTPSKKELLLKQLSQTCCRLQPSPLDGVGVFAIKDIPKGSNPFEGVRNHRWHKFHTDELKQLDPAVMKMIDDFVVIEKDNTVYIPDCSMHGMDLSFYLNNSESPNLMTIDGGLTFVTLRDIKKGEELTAAYETYDHKYEKKNGTHDRP
jgi:SET domain-containing protein